MKNERSAMLACACACIALVLAQDVAPGLAFYHTWQYAALLALGIAAIARYAFTGWRGADGKRGQRLAIATLGALVIAASGLASGLLGPDTERVSRAPGTVAPLPSVGAAAAFPDVDAAALERGRAQIGLRRRDGTETLLGAGERHYAGAMALSLQAQVAAYVEVYDANGRRLTVTQPANAAFLSPVLLFGQSTSLPGRAVPSDAFAAPAAHRVVKALYFAHAPAGGPRGREAVLMAVDDERGRPLPGGIGFVASGDRVLLGGVRIRAWIGRYPALVLAAIPYPLSMWMGAALFIGGIAYGYALPEGQAGGRREGRSPASESVLR